VWIYIVQWREPSLNAGDRPHVSDAELLGHVRWAEYSHWYRGEAGYTATYRNINSLGLLNDISVFRLKDRV
jgi:hypothetical protein